MKSLEAFIPALQHLAKFPGANLSAIARSRGVSELELTEIIGEHFGGVAELNDESFDDFLKKTRLARVDNAERPLADVLTSTKEDDSIAHLAKVDAAPSIDAARVRGEDISSEPVLWKSLNIRPKTFAEMVGPLDMIVALGWKATREALNAGKFSCSYANFSMFKSKVFHAGEPDPEKVKRFLAWARETGRLPRRTNGTEKPPKPKSVPQFPDADEDESSTRPSPAMADIVRATPQPEPKAFVVRLHELRKLSEERLHSLETKLSGICREIDCEKARGQAYEELIAELSA